MTIYTNLKQRKSLIKVYKLLLKLAVNVGFICRVKRRIELDDSIVEADDRVLANAKKPTSTPQYIADDMGKARNIIVLDHCHEAASSS